MKALALALGVLTAPALTIPALADDPTPNLDPHTLSRPGPVGRLVLAQDLFVQGLAMHDPLALIQSARMMQRVGIIAAADRVPQAKGKPLPLAAPPPVPFPLPEATLKTAEVLARGDDALLSLIDATRSELPVPRGAVRQSVSALAPGGTEVWTLAFFGADSAELAVLGNGQSTLSIEVTDETGQSPCTTLASADRLYCRFTPARNGSFTVTVENTGPSVDAYRLITN